MDTTQRKRRPGGGRKPSPIKTLVVRIPALLKPTVTRLMEAYKAPAFRPAGAMTPDPDAPIILLPMFSDKVPAGFPSPATDYVEDRLDLNQLLIVNNEATFFLRAKGHSMIGAGIHDGDILVVDRTKEPNHGHVVIAVVDGEFTVKRLYQQNGTVALKADNPDFADIVFNDGQELLVWGVVTNVVHPL